MSNYPLKRPSRHAVLFILGLVLLSPRASAKTPGTPELLSDLRKSLIAPVDSSAAANQANRPDERPSPVAPARAILANAARYVDGLELQIAQGRFAEAQQLLTQLRQILPAENTNASASIDRLLTSVRAQADELAAQQEAAYAALAADFAAKFESTAPAGDYDDLFIRLAALPPVTSYNNNTAQKIETLRSLIARWQDYLLQSAHGLGEAAGRTLDQFIQEHNRLAILPRSKLIILQETRPKQAKPANDAEALITDLQTRLGAIIAAANTAADFDAFIVELGRVTLVNDGNSQFRAVRRCATHWQSFYAARQNGNLEDAATFLRYFESDRDFDPIFPYAKVKVKLFGSANPEAAFAETLISPGELTPANAMVLDWQIRYRRDHRLPLLFPPEALLAEFQELRMPLMSLNEDNCRFVLEKSSTWDKSPDPGLLGGYAEALARVKRAMLHQAARIYLDLPAAPPPEPGDCFGSYDDRLIAQYHQRKDWPMVHRLLGAKQQLNIQTASDAADYLGFGYLIYAFQLERAGLWSLAGTAYQKTLASRAPRLPVEEIGRRQEQMAAKASQETFSKTVPDKNPSP